MKFRRELDLDLTKPNTNNIDIIYSGLDSVIEYIKANLTGEGKFYALLKISTAARSGIQRLKDAVQQNDTNVVFAWLARNIFELDLVTRFVLKEPTNYKSLEKQFYKDEIEMFEGYKLLIEDTVADPGIDARLKNLRDKWESVDTEKGMPSNIREIAEYVGAKEEYQIFYKTYSKYVHPSIWLIFAPSKLKQNPGFRNIFMMKSQRYAINIYEKVAEAIEDQVNKNG